MNFKDHTHIGFYIKLLCIILSGLFIMSGCGNNKLKIQEDTKFSITIKNKQYEQLILLGDSYDDVRYRINGITKDGYTWTFTIPDSIEQVVKYYQFRTGNYDKKNNIIYESRIFTVNNSDTLSTSEISFDRKNPHINVLYTKNTLIDDFYRIVEDSIYLLKTTSSLDHWKVNLENDGSELDLRLRYPVLGGIPSLQKDKDSTYQYKVKEFCKLVEQYPNSQYLITQLALFISRYKNKNDVKVIYDSFSKDIKQRTYWGKMTRNYLETNSFIDRKLPSLSDDSLTFIVSNPTKYTLIAFSASWCGPCHEQIPILKELYEKYNSKLDIVYLSIDKKETLDLWRDMIKKEKIAWTNLWVDEPNEDMLKLYTVQSIPKTILVLPDNNMLEINLRDKDDRARLNKILMKDMVYSIDLDG